VVAAVAEQRVRPTPGTARLATDGRDRLAKRQELGEIVPVRARHQAGERNPRRVGEQVMLTTVKGAKTRIPR
jgi:hypothetical protein